MSKTFNDVFTEFTEGYIIGRGGEVHPERLGIPATYVKDLYPDLLDYKAVAHPLFDLVVATAPGGSLYHPDG